MGVVDFAQYLQQAINAGSAVEGTAVKVIADNGAEIGDAVFKVINGGNGTAAEVGIATQATAGGGLLATGMAYLTMDLTAAAAAWAPTLGLIAGVGLYSLAPEFWSDLGNTLYDNGKTLGGKVIAYWNGENVYFDKESIEIFKNKLLAEGVYDTGIQAESYEFPDIADLHLSFAGSRSSEYVSYIGTDGLQHELHFPDHANYDAVCYIKKQDNFPQQPRLWYITASKTIGSDTYTYNGKTVHWGKGSSEVVGGTSAVTYGGAINNATRRSLYDQYFRETAWLLLYGSEGLNPDIDPGAVYPTRDQEIDEIYPGWIPYEYPIELPHPEELPKVYPVKYPGIGDDPYPEQGPAQDPLPEPVPIIYPIILPEFPIPEPIIPPEPEPIIPDPEPQPDPEPIEPEEPTPPDPDPIDPNEPPIPSPPIIIPSLPTTVNSNKLFTVYNPSSSQLDALGGYLWDSSIIAAIRDIWQDPMDGLISLQQVYVSPLTGSAHNIILGFLDSGVASPIVTQQFVEVDCGSVTVPENKKNATDYAPYTSLHVYLPFIGIVELDTNECMNSTISVKYKVDVYTGTCLATISVDRDEDMPNDPILYTYSGNCSQQLPLTSGNATGMLSALVGAVTAGISVGSGGGLSTLAGAQLLGNSLTHDMMHVSHSGNISANAGIMGQKKPYLIIGRRHCYDANNYNSYYGFPANKTVVLGNHQGFCRVKTAWIKTTALQEEYNQIMELLENGVFI